jgi:hypothetical protein
MLELTEGFVGMAESRRRWFGQSDQVALASLLTKQHGFHGVMPGTRQGKRQLDTHTTIRTRYRYPAAVSVAAADNATAPSKQVFNIALLSCMIYNGAGATVSCVWCVLCVRALRSLSLSSRPHPPHPGGD